MSVPLPMAARLMAIALCLTLMTQVTSFVHAKITRQVGQVDEWVLLKNGNMIHGTAQIGFEKTTIELENGSRMVMDTDAIATTCIDHREAYSYQRARLDDDDMDGQRELFLWCLRFKLFDLAQQQINTLQQTRIPPNELYSLFRQLELASDLATRERDRGARIVKGELQPMQTGDTIRSESASTNMDPNVRQVGFEDESAGSTNVGALSAVELESMIDDFDAFGVQSFKRVVEPILIKSCTDAGCHHDRQEVMPLFRMERGHAVPKRMSQQNLVQVLRYVTTDDQTASPLLKAALEAHGGSDRAGISNDSREAILLTEWVELMQKDAIAAGLARKTAAKVKDPHRENDRPVATIPTLEDLKNPRRKRPDESMEVPTRAPSPDKSIPSIPKLNPLASPALQNDPFDPNEFNRRYHPNGKK